MFTKIFLELSEDIEKIFLENSITIEEILDREGLEAEVTTGTAPYQSEKQARTKDLVTIILASSAAVAAVCFAISQILHEVFNKPHLVEIYECDELRDDNNEILLDDKGKPLLKPKKRYELIESQKNRNMEFNLGIKNGIVIKINSGDQVK